MMNILLVDDEEFVLDYLEDSINWPDYGINRVFRANSADEALDLTEKETISILITDIRMPEKSGLELLAGLHLQKPEIKVILLSGYAEFEYAKSALQQGAADYLLKPVTADEVETCLGKVVLQIHNERQEKMVLSKAKNVLRLGDSRTRQHLLLELVLGKRCSPIEITQQLLMLHLPFLIDDDCILALIRVETDRDDDKPEDLELYRYAVLNMAEEILFEQVGGNPSLWWCVDSHRLLVVVLPSKLLDGIAGVEIRTKKLQEAVKKYLKKSISVVLSCPFPLGQDLNRPYLQALNEFWQFIGTRRDSVLLMNEIADPMQVKPLKRFYESPSIRQLMDTGRWEEVVERLESVLEELDSPPYQTQHHLVEVVYYLYS
ncbi:MAG: response regulator, partial [Gorillibacterium sp.]|nr:response regulator [Gorillibacterium sp.]